jgi:hypothetical protein
MQINKIIETEDGAVEVNATLSPEQVQFLLEVGLSIVLAKGAKTFMVQKEREPSSLIQGTGVMN